MSALMARIEALEKRVEKVQQARASLIPANRYISAGILLENLGKAYRQLTYKYRFAQTVTGSDGGVDLTEIRKAVARLLGQEFGDFVTAQLAASDKGLNAQVDPLIAAIKPQTLLLDAHVASFQQKMEAELESARVQADLFKALGITDATGQVSMLRTRFRVLMEGYKGTTWNSNISSEWQTIRSELTGLQGRVAFDKRVGLSAEALAFVRKVLAGWAQAPSLADLTPSILAELQKLNEFARTVKIMRP